MKQAESYGRGQYIIKEGEVPQKEAKFYIIQQGECMLEKRFFKELRHPYEKTKSLVSKADIIDVAVLGKLVFPCLIFSMKNYHFFI